MNQKAEVYETLEALISENESGLFSVWRLYRIPLELNPNNLLAAYSKYGEPFAQAVDRAVNQESFSGTSVVNLLDAGLKAITTASAIENITASDDEEEKDQPNTNQKMVMGMPSKIFKIGVFTLSLFIVFLIINYKTK